MLEVEKNPARSKIATNLVMTSVLNATQPSISIARRRERALGALKSFSRERLVVAFSPTWTSII